MTGGSCRGAGVRVAGRGGSGEAHWIRRRCVCGVCGKHLTMTGSGRVPRHVPAPEPQPHVETGGDDAEAQAEVETSEGSA